MEDFGVSGFSAASGPKTASLIEEKKLYQINAMSISDKFIRRFVLVLVLVLVLEAFEPLSIEDEDEYEYEHDLESLSWG